MMVNIPRHSIGVGLIVALASGLYLPFSGNPPIFDDIVLFSGEKTVGKSIRAFRLDCFDTGTRGGLYPHSGAKGALGWLTQSRWGADAKRHYVP